MRTELVGVAEELDVGAESRFAKTVRVEVVLVLLNLSEDLSISWSQFWRAKKTEEELTAKIWWNLLSASANLLCLTKLSPSSCSSQRHCISTRSSRGLGASFYSRIVSDRSRDERIRDEPS